MEQESAKFFSGDPFERSIAIMIAAVTVFAAIVGYLQTTAGVKADQFARTAQSFAIEAVSLRASGEIEASYAWSDLWRVWSELETLSILGEDFDDTDMAERYLTVQERMETLNPLMQPPYFAPQDEGTPNIEAFEADLFIIESTFLVEQFIITFEVSSAWGAKADSYVAHLTLLAVSLFLYGLSTTIASQARWVFVSLGTLFTIGTLIWVIIVYVRPIERIPEEAVQAYAEGVGWNHQSEFEAAIEQFDKALTLAPNYANAHYQKGLALFDINEIAQAAVSLEAAQAAGRVDFGTVGELVRTYYYLGRQTDSIKMAETGIGLNPAEPGYYFDLGLNHLTLGQDEQAQAAYDRALNTTTEIVAQARGAGQEPPGSLWWNMELAATDLDALNECLSTQDCFNAPPYETLNIEQLSSDRLFDLSRQIKQHSVALEYTGQPIQDPLEAIITTLEFGGYEDDISDELLISEEFPAGTDEVSILLAFENMTQDHLLVVKVFLDTQEDASLRIAQPWDFGPAGEAELLISKGLLSDLDSGEYFVEVYIDGHLLQQSGFFIAEE